MSEELNCSSGAKILIERMKDNPDEFKGLRWTALISSIVRNDTNALLSERDRAALREAYGTYIQEPMLMAKILQTLLEPEPEPEDLTLSAMYSNEKYAKALAASMHSTKQGILSAGLSKAFDSAYNDYRDIYGTPGETETMTYKMSGRYNK